MNRALQYLAWFRIFSAIGSLSYQTSVARQTVFLALAPHLIDSLLYWCLKQRPGRTRQPASVLAFEIKAREMTKYTGHGHRAIPPGTAKIEVEFIVLDILIASDCMLRRVLVGFHHNIHKTLTV